MADPDEPDLILHNGLVITGGAGDESTARPGREALAVAGDRIVAVGGSELLDLAGTKTTVLDLDGRTLLPGINDGHLHVGGYASSRPPASLDVSPQAVGSIADIAAAIAERVAETPPGTWIRGWGWIGASLADLSAAQPTAASIDPVSPRHPVVLTDFSGHTVWTNSMAMELAGVDRDSVVPVGGVMLRFGDGEPTGVFQESAQRLITDVVPPLSDVELEAAVRAALGEFHRQGITSITDAALNPLPGRIDALGGARVFDLLKNLCGPHDVAIRTNVLLNFSPLGSSLLADTEAGLARWEPEPSDRSWFAVRGLKIFADGVPPNCTAWMSHAYPDGSHGCLTVGGDTDADRLEELGRLISTCHRTGLQVGIHVTGDRATEAVVDGLMAAMEATPRPDPRHYLIHGPFVSEAALARAGRAGIGINVQPTLKSASAHAIEGLFGRELSDYQWPLRSIMNSGCVMASSSDAPVTSPNWRTGVASAVLRESAQNGEVYGADQRLLVDEVLRSYTAGGAWQDGAEGWKGTLAAGKVADLCVVDGRLSTDDPSSFSAMDVSLTMVGGTVVHGEAQLDQR